MNYYKCEYCHDYFDEDGKTVNAKQTIGTDTFADGWYDGDYSQSRVLGLCQVEDIAEKFVCPCCADANN